MKFLFSIFLFSPFLFAADEAATKFTNESELGVVLSTGNSKTRTFNAKQLNSYEWSQNTVRFNGRFLGSTSKDQEVARLFSFGLRYERALVEKLSAYVGELFESDVFSGYDRRWSTDVGARYNLIKDETTTWAAELGYRYIAEHRTTPSSQLNTHNVRIFTEASQQLRKGLDVKAWIEFLRSLDNANIYKLNSELALSVLLNEVFSLKTGFLVQYNNFPAPGAAYTDTLFSTALVAKL